MIIGKIITKFIVIFFGMWIGALSTTLYSRLPDDNVKIGPTHKPTCDNCSAIIPFRYFFPIFGYIASKGRCKNCNIKIPIIYTILEIIITTYIFLLSLSYKEINEGFIVNSIFSAYIITLLFIFIKHNRVKTIYIWLTILLATLALCYNNRLPDIMNLFFCCVLSYFCSIILKKKVLFISNNEHILLVVLFVLNGIQYTIAMLLAILLMFVFLPLKQRYKNINRDLLISMSGIFVKKTLFIFSFVYLLIRNITM